MVGDPVLYCELFGGRYAYEMRVFVHDICRRIVDAGDSNLFIQVFGPHPR